LKKSFCSQFSAGSFSATRDTPPFYGVFLLSAGQVKMIMLYFYGVNRSTIRALLGFPIRKPDFTDVFSATSYFNAEKLTILANIDPVIHFFISHAHITSIYRILPQN
jgi:hypothetical protein